MIVINTLDDNRFSINGIAYLRRFISIVGGDSVSIKGIYDSTIELVSDNYANYTVNGNTYGSALLLQSALVDVLYSSTKNNSFSFRNLLINNLFTVNQRGYATGVNTTVNNQYTFDRWRIKNSGTHIDYANNIPENGYNHVFVPLGTFLEQEIEAINIVTGFYTLSWDGTATATVNNIPVTNGQQIYISYGSNVIVSFTNGTVYYPHFFISDGTKYREYRSYDMELILCKRYYEVVNVGLHKFYMQNNFNPYTGKTFNFKEKRTLPTISFITAPVAYLVSGSLVANAINIGVGSKTDAYYALSWSAPIDNQWMIFTGSTVAVNAEI